MKQCLLRAALTWTLALLPMLAAAAPVSEIGDEEYAVYSAALGNLHGVFAVPAWGDVVFSTTLSGRRLDAETVAHLARSGLAPDLALIEDFNHKNAQGHRILAGRLPPSFKLSDNWTPAFRDRDGEGSVERLELSRVGFDSEGRRALVVVSHTFRGGGRAYHNSGGYLMLERQDGRWTVTGKTGGWARYY